MVEIETPEDVREHAEVLQTGQWHIASIEQPCLAVQSNLGKARALDKLVDRWEEYTSRTASDGDDIRMPVVENDPRTPDDESIEQITKYLESDT